MKELCFLLAWLVPGGILFLRERKEYATRRHLESQGYEIQAPIFWQRTRNAKKMAAAVYAVILIVMQSFFFYAIRSTEGAVVMTIIFMVIGIIAYENALKLALKGQQTGQTNSQEVLRKRDEGYVKRPQPLVPADEHGRSELLSAEQVGLTSGDDLEPIAKAGAR
jgi:hypothetical protein